MAKYSDLKTAAEFSAQAAEWQAEIAQRQTLLEQLRGTLRKGPFELSEAECKALRQRIRDTEEEIEERGYWIEEAALRQHQAEQLEALEMSRSRHAQGRRTQKSLAAVYVAIDETATKLGKLVADARRLSTELAEANAFTRANGHPELHVDHPTAALAQQIGRHVGDIVASNGIQVIDYVPHRHPDGPALAEMRHLKL